MKSGLSFLVAAKRCEIAELQALALTSALVNVTGRLVHGLQRERGLFNLYLGSNAGRFAVERQAQISECLDIETELRTCFDSLDTESPMVGNGARLFSRIAHVLHGLDALPGLRAQVEKQTWAARKATEAYVRLIAGLLAVVFEPSSPFHQNAYMKSCLFAPYVVAQSCQTPSLAAAVRLVWRKNPPISFRKPFGETDY